LIQLTHLYEDGYFVNVREQDAKKLPKLSEEVYGYVDEDEDKDKSDGSDDFDDGNSYFFLFIYRA
jgi:hypothetical protein